MKQQCKYYFNLISCNKFQEDSFNKKYITGEEDQKVIDKLILRKMINYDI